MSLLIKGMDMPKHSGKNNIPDLHKACIKVYANGKCDLVLMEGKEHYPLVEVPTPHGNLIDRDDILDILDKIILKPDSPVQRCMAMAVKEILIGQPIVIESGE